MHCSFERVNFELNEDGSDEINAIISNSETIWRREFRHAKSVGKKFAGSRRPETRKSSSWCDVTRHASPPYEISRQYTFTVAVWITASLDDISYRPLDIADMRRMRPAMPASQVSDDRPTVLLLHTLASLYDTNILNNAT